MTTAAGVRRRRRRTGDLTLSQHLRELRRRLLLSALAILVGAIVAFIFTDTVIVALTAPIAAIAAEQGSDLVALNFDSVTSSFDLRVRIAIAIGLAAAAPVWLTQLWLFFVPALTRREALACVAFILSAVPLFFAGCVTGWMLTPHAIALLSSFAPQGTAQFFQSSAYYDFVLKLVLAVGVAFVLPVFLVLLNVTGVLSARAIAKGWRVAAVVAMVFAAIATPAADVLSMVVLAGILLALYCTAIGVTFLLERRKARGALARERRAIQPTEPLTHERTG